MFGENKNLKASQGDAVKDTSSMPTSSVTAWQNHLGSYTKTNKLITALYMVTDIIDKDEPIRNKLRTLGAGIISDMHLIQQNRAGNTVSLMHSKISEIMSFLDIALVINIISEMNCNILRKEFAELNESIKESTGKIKTLDGSINLSEYFKEELPSGTVTSFAEEKKLEVPPASSTRIGVQEGSTLLKALSDVGVAKTPAPRVEMSDRKPVTSTSAPVSPKPEFKKNEGFDILKKQRRDSIINIIKNNGGNATIKDIKFKINTGVRGSLSLSEKTLQRELMSMTKDGVLHKTGEKRWSRYSITN